LIALPFVFTHAVACVTLGTGVVDVEVLVLPAYGDGAVNVVMSTWYVPMFASMLVKNVVVVDVVVVVQLPAETLHHFSAVAPSWWVLHIGPPTPHWQLPVLT
jgi:hypothetical protein